MKILIIIITMTAGLAFAGDSNTAYNMVCKNLPFESDRNKCLEVIKQHTYFDNQALEICASFTFDSNKTQCLGTNAEKLYIDYEIDACKNSTFDSDKLNCLKVNGRAINNGGGNWPCLPNQIVLQQLQSGLNNLRNGDLGTLDKRLQYLISNFSNPSCN